MAGEFFNAPLPSGEEQGGGFFNSLSQGIEDSVRAAGMMVGLYKAQTPEEAQTLRRRFFADAASLATATGVGLAAESGGASMTIPVLARMILAGALSGGAGGAAYAGVQGEPVGPAALGGAAAGAAFGALPGLVRQGRTVARGLAAETAAPAAESVATAATGIKTPEAGAEFLNKAVFGKHYTPPGENLPASPFGLAFGATETTPLNDPAAIDFGHITVAPAPPGQAARVLVAAGGKGPLTQEAISEAIKAFRQKYGPGSVRVLGRTPLRRGRGRLNPLTDVSEVSRMDPASELASVNAGTEGMLKNINNERFAKVWGDIQKIYRRGVQISGTAIGKMGAIGSRLAAQMDDVLGATERNASRSMVEARAALGPLSHAQRIKVTGILNGDITSDDPLVTAAADKIRSLLDEVQHAGAEVGLPEVAGATGKVRPYRYSDNFWPYVYSDKTVRRLLDPSSPEHQRAIQRILSMRAGAYSEQQAEALLKRFLKTPPELRYNHLQFARDLALPEFERDPMKVLPLFFMRSWKRIEVGRQFGPRDEIAAQMIRGLREGGHDWEMVRDVYRAFADKLPLDYNELIKATRAFNTISLLSTSGIVQFAQHANTIAYTGFKNYIRGLGAYFTKEGKDYAARTGAYMQELLGEMLPEEVPPGPAFLNFRALKNVITGPNRSANWLQYIGLTPLDKANRAIAALAGRFHADEVAQKFAEAAASNNTGRLTTLGRELVRLKLKPEEVLANGGRLSADQHLIASQAVSHITQFRGSVLDMPAWARTQPMGRLAYLFKTFSVQQFRYTKMLLDEAKKGNPGPALKFIAASGTLTPLVGAAVRTMRGRPAPDDPRLAYLEAALNAGAIGIAYDALRATAEGPEWILGFIGGPTASQGAALLHEGYQAAAQQQPKPLMRDVLRHTPLVGPHLANWLIPKEQ